MIIADQTPIESSPQAEPQTPDGHAHKPVSWLPLPLLFALAVWFGRSLAPWAYMCALALAIYFSLKWLTWRRERGDVTHTAARSAAYLLAWPGMDAATFLGDSRARKPQSVQWGWALTKTCMGILLMWVCARHVPATLPLLQGWIRLLALILLLHFGSFELIALGWQSVGVNAQAIMQQPLSSYSLSEFWGKRSNLGFRQLSHEFIFQPSHRVIGTQGARAGRLAIVLQALPRPEARNRLWGAHSLRAPEELTELAGVSPSLWADTSPSRHYLPNSLSALPTCKDYSGRCC